MNKEQLIKEYDEKAKALRDEFISKLEDDKKEFELTYPKDKEMVYLADSEVTSVFYDAVDKSDRNIFEHGLYFNTEKEAEQHLKERKLLFKIQQWAKIKNDGWEPKWDNVKFNYRLIYNIEDEIFKVDFGRSYKYFNILPYFKSKEIAQECIDLFGDEILEVLVDGK